MKKRFFTVVCLLAVTVSIPLLTISRWCPTPAAEKEIQKILQDLEDMGYTVSESREAGIHTPEYTKIAGQATFSAQSVRLIQLRPGEGALLFHTYDSPEQREEGAQKRRDFFATASHSLLFYETKYSFVTFACPPKQEQYAVPVREYFEKLTEEILRK